LSANILKLPCGKNKKLKELVRIISNDNKLQTYWKCANITAINRMGYTDHGPIHVKIVANSALKMLRILIKHGVKPNIVKDYQMTNEDAELIVVLASIFHDLGMAIAREEHEEYSIFLGLEFLKNYLEKLYDTEQATIITSEVLHALSTHHHQRKPLTIEAGIVRVADALDMEQGRARIPFQAGKIDIHSVSALAIQNVKIEEGSTKPITIQIAMTSSAGIFQVDQLLRNRIQHSGLKNYIHVIAMIIEGKEPRIIDKFEL
jgi:metal-dependent HD superfamily phosphatase/phosphodiesterase